MLGFDEVIIKITSSNPSIYNARIRVYAERDQGNVFPAAHPSRNGDLITG